MSKWPEILWDGWIDDVAFIAKLFLSDIWYDAEEGQEGDNEEDEGIESEGEEDEGIESEGEEDEDDEGTEERSYRESDLEGQVATKKRFLN